MNRPTLPPFATVLALAERLDCPVPVIELAQMYNEQALTDDVISLLWPNVSERVRALYAGRSVYHGSACRVHGTTERLASNCSCVECHRGRVRVSHARHYQANYKPRRQAARLANREQYNQRQREYHAARKERIAA